MGIKFGSIENEMLLQKWALAAHQCDFKGAQVLVDYALGAFQWQMRSRVFEAAASAPFAAVRRHLSNSSKYSQASVRICKFNFYLTSC